MELNKQRYKGSLAKPWVIVLIVVASMLSGILFSKGIALQSWKSFFIASLWSLIIWITQWYGNESILIALDNRISWLKQPLKRLIIGFLALITYSTVAVLVVNIAFTYFIYDGIPGSLASWTLHNGRIAIIISLNISSLFTAVGFFISWRQSKNNEDRLNNELLDYQYRSLVNQVNPHFLFNSLNVLTSLVREDADLAVKFIHQLSKVYRYTLEHRDNDLVTLEEEKKFLESYLFLLQIRFERALKTTLRFSGDPNGLLIPMALQILVENAIKHNTVTPDKPLSISIEEQGGYISVENNLQLPARKAESLGFGLENIRKRLKFLTDKPLIIEQTEDTFKAKIPIIFNA
jgi:two-component system LytT family sensor kinase